MNIVKKTLLLHMPLCILMEAQAVVAEEPTDFPPIDVRFKELYNELQKEADALLQKFKDAYPKVPEAVWQRYYEIPKESFAAIKKEYAGTPACNGLPEKIDLEWEKWQFGIFLEQYTQCAAERNGVDPTKINIMYNPDDHKLFENNKNAYIHAYGFRYVSKIFWPYYELATQHKINSPMVLVNKNLFYKYRAKNHNHYLMNTTMVDKVLAGISNNIEQIAFLYNVIKQYYGEEELTQQRFKKLAQELLDIQNNNSYIIAAMKSEDVMNRVMRYASQEEQPAFCSTKFDWKKILAYALKIKKILYKSN